MLRAERGTPGVRRQPSPFGSDRAAAVPPSPAVDAGPSSARQRQAKKDDAIRKKLEMELARRKRHQRGFPGNNGRRGDGGHVKAAGTVSALRPSPATTVEETSSITDVAQLMAAKRCDCVLVTSGDGALSGIFTDKDLAYRVVSEGLDPRALPVAQVMTPNPNCCTDTAMATEALAQMVAGGYRHLPVQDETGDVVGVLDITKCLYEALEKLERAHSDSQRLIDAVAIMDSFAGATPQGVADFVNDMREKMACPNLASVVRQEACPTDLNVRESVREAVKIMKAFHHTAVLVTENGRLAGIFTTKDCVVRVVAAGLDPGSTSLVRVMTPHPDTVSIDTTILQALRRMHSSRYLHLPVVNEAGGLIGMTDVLQLTYAMLERVKNISTSEAEGPMWNKFWQSTLIAEDVASVHSASVSELATREFSAELPGDGVESVQSGAHHSGTRSARQQESASAPIPGSRLRSPSSAGHADRGSLKTPISAVGEELAASESSDGFVFKFREKSGAVHRFTVTGRTTMAELLVAIQERVQVNDSGNEGDFVHAVRAAGSDAGDAHGVLSTIKISYLDDENDQVVLAKDEDLTDALQVSRKCRWPVLPLFVSVKRSGGRWESLGNDDEKTVEAEIRRRAAGGETGGERKRRQGDPAKKTEGLLLPFAIGVGVAVVAFLFARHASR